MQYGICQLGIVPLRLEPYDTSEMVSQLLYGEHFEVLEQRKNWSKIRVAYDKYEAWVDSKQYLELSQKDFFDLDKTKSRMVSDLVEFSEDKDKNLIPIPLGSVINGIPLLGHSYEGNRTSLDTNKKKLVGTAFLYLNAPYLWGGKSPFGIDCSGLVQMVYKLNGHKLFRDACQQAKQGEPLSFIEESEPGDLAFFDNKEGNIIHVGIILKNNHIIHAHGKVRVDRLDHQGIFNVDTNRYSHNLRAIKKIV